MSLPSGLPGHSSAPYLAPPSPEKPLPLRKRGRPSEAPVYFLPRNSFPVTCQEIQPLPLFVPSTIEANEARSLPLEIRAPHSISEKEERGEKASGPPTQPAHVRGGEAAFALREVEPPFCKPLLASSGTLAITDARLVRARETPLPFPCWQRGGRTVRRVLPNDPGAGSRGSVSEPEHVPGGSGAPAWGRPAPRAAATCERQAWTCSTRAVREPRLGQDTRSEGGVGAESGVKDVQRLDKRGQAGVTAPQRDCGRRWCPGTAGAGGL